MSKSEDNITVNSRRYLCGATPLLQGKRSGQASLFCDCLRGVCTELDRYHTSGSTQNGVADVGCYLEFVCV